MCGCGVEYACGSCECGCGHNQDSYISWQLGYRAGRLHAAQSIAQMRDVDEAIMEEIESDPSLNEAYILVRRIDAELVARGDGHDNR
jgi:hypothetical protein